MRAFIRTPEDFWNIVIGVLFPILFAGFCLYLARTASVPHSIGVFDFFLLISATYRIIRLIAYDKITAFVREFFAASESDLGKTIHEILICPWCIGIWAALMVMVVYYTSPYGWFFLLALATSAIASFLQIVTNMLIRIAEESRVRKELLESKIRTDDRF